MEKKRIIIAALALCCVGLVAMPAISQTKTTKQNKTVTTTNSNKVEATSPANKKIEAKANNGKTAKVTKKKVTEADCTERIKRALNAESVRFESGACMLYIKKNNSSYMYFHVGNVNYTVSDGITVNCHSGAKCISASGNQKKSTHGLKFSSRTQDAYPIKYCMDMLHNKCKKM